MATPLPALGGIRPKSAGITASPDGGSPHLGDGPRGQAVGKGAPVTQRSGAHRDTAPPDSTPPAGLHADRLLAGLPNLQSGMNALQGMLAGALQELSARNTTANSALRDAAGAAVSPRGAAPPPASLLSPTRLLGSALVAASPPPGHIPGALMLASGTAARIPTAPQHQPMQPSGPRAPVGPDFLGLGTLASPAAGPGAAGALGPRWGATEGGRDGLAWVRSLVKHAEAQPLQPPRAVAAAPTDATMRKPGPPVLPMLRVERRDDVLVLGQWLQDMVGQLSSKQAEVLAGQIHGTEVGSGAPGTAAPGNAHTTVLELADSVLHVYGVAFEELRRQVAVECRERATLLGLLWQHLASAMELRANLAAEARLGAVQGEVTELLSVRERLESDVVAAAAATEGAEHSKRAQAVAATASTRALAGKLAAAQAKVEEISAQAKVANLALTNEVERRLATEKQLALTKQLLSKSEAEWLTFRAQVTALEGEKARLQAALEASREEFEAAAAAADAAHKEFAALLSRTGAQDAEAMRMRRDFETDEILILSQKQQIRELEAQLSQLKSFQRDQALKLGAVAADKEAVEMQRDDLARQLAETEEGRAAAEATVAETTAALVNTRFELAACEARLEHVQTQLKGEVTETKRQLHDATTQLRQTSDALSDAQYMLNKVEKQRRELEGEMVSVKELLGSVCSVMESQGVDGVPNSKDSGWTVTGPLGAVQRAINVSVRQLGVLWDRLETSRMEVEVLNERVSTELKQIERLQEELHASRITESSLMSLKETTELQLNAAHAAKRVLESELATLQDEMSEMKLQLEAGASARSALESELEKFRPLQEANKRTNHQLNDVTESYKVTSEALVLAKEDLRQMTEQVDFFRHQTEALMNSNDILLQQVKDLDVAQGEAATAQALVDDLKDEMAELQNQLDEALKAHSNTLHQLEVARFLLQGLQQDPEHSPPSSTTSQPLMGWQRPSSAASAGTGGAMEGQLPRRPGTAPTPSRRPLSALGRPPVDNEGDPAGAQVMHVGSLGSAGTRDLTHSSGSLSLSRVPSRTGSEFGGPANAAQVRAMAAAVFSSPRSSGSGGAASLAAMAPNVADALQARGVGSRLDATYNRWLVVKANILATFCARLRAALVVERQQCVELEVQLAQAALKSTQEAIEREKYFDEDVLADLRGELQSLRSELKLQLEDVRSSIPVFHADVVQLVHESTKLTRSAQDAKATRFQDLGVASQTSEQLEPRWAAFIQSLPAGPPVQPLAPHALGDAIVRIYVRAMATVESTPVWGADRVDTVYDAIMEHYTSQAAPGTFNQAAVQDPEGPIGRFLRCVRASADSTRAGLFACLAGVSPDGTVWPPATWYFLLHLLHCLKLLLAGTWTSTLRAWRLHPQGAYLPLQAVYDVVGNLYNVQSPADLHPSVMMRLASIVLPGQSGPQVDMDALLLLLVSEFNRKACPRAALLYPRRLTDGALFNLFNTLGHNAHLDALSDPRTSAIISTAARPGSTFNPSNKTRMSAQDSAEVSPRPATAIAAQQVEKATKESAQAHKARLQLHMWISQGYKDGEHFHSHHGARRLQATSSPRIVPTSTEGVKKPDPSATIVSALQ